MTAKRDEPLSIIRQFELMRDLQRLANDRAQAESQIHTALDTVLHDAAHERDVKSSEIESHYSSARGAAQAEYDTSREATQQRYERERDAAQQQYKGLRHDVESTHAQVLRSAVTEQQESSWETLAVFDAIKGRPRERMLEAVRQLRVSHAELMVLESDATAIMKMRRQWQEFPPVEASTECVTTGRLSDQSEGNSVERALERVRERTAAVREAGLTLYDQRLPRLFESAEFVAATADRLAARDFAQRLPIWLASVVVVVADQLGPGGGCVGRPCALALSSRADGRAVLNFKSSDNCWRRRGLPSMPRPTLRRSVPDATPRSSSHNATRSWPRCSRSSTPHSSRRIVGKIRR